MKKIDRQILLFITLIAVFFACFQPAITGINIEKNIRNINIIDKNSALFVANAQIINR